MEMAVHLKILLTERLHVWQVGHVAGETEIGRRAGALANDLIAFPGLLVLGFPLTTATIRIVMVSWVLITIAFIQVALMYFQPLLRFEEIGNESY